MSKTSEHAKRPRLIWEKVENKGSADAVEEIRWTAVFRAEVPGGWLLMISKGGSISFYPDPDHEWK